MKDTDLDRREEEKDISQISAFNQSVFGSLTEESTPPLEKVVSDMAKRLYDRKNIYFITDLTTPQINNYYKYNILDKMFYQEYAWREEEEHPELFHKFTTLFEDLLALAVSLKRQGRIEGRDIVSRVREEAKEEQSKNRIG